MWSTRVAAFFLLFSMGSAVLGEGVFSPLILCSPISGILLGNGGIPAAGVTVHRKWEWAWTGATGSDSTTTDAEGRFSFGPVTGSSFTARILPHEPDIRIQVYGRHADEERLLLSVSKGNYSLGSEAIKIGQAGPALNIKCRLDSEPNDGGVYWGTCTSAN